MSVSTVGIQDLFGHSISAELIACLGSGAAAKLMKMSKIVYKLKKLLLCNDTIRV